MQSRCQGSVLPCAPPASSSTTSSARSRRRTRRRRRSASGRCAAYDPFNAVDASGTTATNAHKYTILPLEFGLCGGCNKKFITGEELTILDYVVCNQNDWNKVKQYYIQGIKGLMVVYNREIATQKAQKATRNHLMTLAPQIGRASCRERV